MPLPGVPDKGDVSNFLDARGTIEQLHELAAAAPEWTASVGPRPSSNGVHHKDDSRPEILISTEEDKINDQAVAA